MKLKIIKNNKNIICFMSYSLLMDRTLASLPSPENNGNNPQQTQLLHSKQRKPYNSWTKDEDALLIGAILIYGPNWPKVAEGILNRNANQCREHFKKLQRKISPKKIRNPWTQEEDELLKILVSLYGKKWPKVANNIPNRSAYRCKQRWEGLEQKKNGKNGPWDEKEEEQLKKGVEEYGTSNWGIVSKFVPSRSPRQCRNHWVKCCDPRRIHRAWTEEEDENLIACYSKFGPQWKEIAPFFPGRTLQDLQNHSRYIPIDDNSPPWTEEEDENLIACYSKFGPQWKEIVPFFPERTLQDLQRHWKRIAPDSKQTTPSIKENQSSLPGGKGVKLSNFFIKENPESTLISDEYHIINVPGDGKCGWWAILASSKASSTNEDKIKVSRSELTDLLKKVAESLKQLVKDYGEVKEDTDSIAEKMTQHWESLGNKRGNSSDKLDGLRAMAGVDRAADGGINDTKQCMWEFVKSHFDASAQEKISKYVKIVNLYEEIDANLRSHSGADQNSIDPMYKPFVQNGQICWENFIENLKKGKLQFDYGLFGEFVSDILNCDLCIRRSGPSQLEYGLNDSPKKERQEISIFYEGTGNAGHYQAMVPNSVKTIEYGLSGNSDENGSQSSLPGKTVPDVGKNWKRIVLSGKQTTANGGKNQSSLPGEMDERKVKLSSLLRPSNEIITPPPPLIIPGGS